MLKNVLLVDDDASIRRISEISLTRIGRLNVVAADSGLSALRFLEDFTPDLILLDVMMPGMDGPALLLRLREIERLAQIPVVFMTAKVQKHEVQAYFDLGVSGVIMKPFDPTTLPLQLKRIFEESATVACVA